jgi:hypothetical protein
MQSSPNILVCSSVRRLRQSPDFGEVQRPQPAPVENARIVSAFATRPWARTRDHSESLRRPRCSVTEPTSTTASMSTRSGASVTPSAAFASSGTCARRKKLVGSLASRKPSTKAASTRSTCHKPEKLECHRTLTSRFPARSRNRAIWNGQESFQRLPTQLLSAKWHRGFASDRVLT